MKFSRASLRFPLGILAGVALLIGCQLGGDPDPVVDTTITAKGTVEFSDLLRLPDFGVWRTNNASRPADTGRGSVTCGAGQIQEKKDCSQDFALKAVLGSDLLVQDVYALGVHFATFKYSQTGSVPRLTLLRDSIRLFAMEDTLIREFNRQYKGDKKPTAADLIAYYAKLLLDADPSVKDSALPRGMVADTVKKILVQVAAQNGITAKLLAAKSLLGLTDEAMIRTITDVLVKAGVKIDITILYPPAPVRAAEALKVLSDLTEGEDSVAVSGAFAWEGKGIAWESDYKVVTAAGTVDENIVLHFEKPFDPTNGLWILSNNLTLKAKRGASIGTDTLIVRVFGGSDTATSKTAFKVLRGDTTVPKLSITEPAPGTEVPNTTEKIKVAVDATDTMGIAEVKIGTTVLTASPYSTEVDLAVGYNIIAVQVKDNSGLVSTDQVIVRRLASTTSSDATSPVITLRSPLTDTTVVATGLPSIELSWSATDNVGLKKVTLNGAEILGTAGVYTKSVPLHDGDNVFEIKAFDDAGNADTVSAVIKRPADLSKAGITPPSDQTVAADVTTLKLTWTITNSHKATKITLNGTALTVGAEVASEVALKPGANAFTLVVSGADGVSVSETVVITRTVLVVLPAITALADRSVGADIDTATLTWAIANSDKAKSAALNGEPIAVGATISKLVKLDPGPNLFKLTLKDSSGTEVSSSVTITRAIDTDLLGVMKLSDRSVSPETATDTLTWTILNPSKAVSATLNGKAVTPGATIGARVTLSAGNNLFILVVKGAKGDSVADTVIVARTADVTGPSIVWVSPTKSVEVDATVTSFAVQVKVTDPSGVDSVRLNGTLTKASATGEYAMTLALPKPDGNPIKVVVEAWDTKGNVTKDSLSVTRDAPDGTNKPIIKLLKPAKATENALPFDSTTIRIEAEITDALLAIDVKSVNFGGVLATATGSVYSADVPVAPTGAPTTIKITAANANGIASTLDVMVTRAKDAVKPVITPDVSTKTQSVDFETKSFAFSWTVSDNHKVTSIIYNGAPQTVAATVKQTLPLDVGENKATLVATDSTGNTDSSVVVITRKQDATPPVVTITKPAATSTVVYGTPSVEVTASATDAGTGIKSLTIGGKAAPLAGGTVSIALGASKNVIKVVAIDNAGNTATDSVVVTVATDEVDPTVKITSPVDKKFLENGITEVLVTVSASDNAGGSGIDYVTVNGKTLTGTTYTVTGLKEGDNTITAEAVDNAGNKASDTIKVIRMYKVATPTFVTAPGSVAPGTVIKLTCETSSAVIKYTRSTTGTKEYTYDASGIAINADETITAWATLTNNTTSDKTSAKFTVFTPAGKPTFSKGTGSYEGAQSVTLSTSTSGAQVCYTMGANPAAPTSAAPSICVPSGTNVTVSATSTIRAIATKAGYTNSDEATAKYTITPPDVNLASITVGTVTKPVTGTTIIWDSLDGLTASVKVTAKPNSFNATASINGGAGTTMITLTDDAATVKIIVSNGSAKSQEYTLKLTGKHLGALYDSRSKTYYEAIKLGDIWWTRRNLDYSGSEAIGSCPDDLPENCTSYGRIYNWNEAQNACPENWRLPRVQDWSNVWDIAQEFGSTRNDILQVYYKDGWAYFWTSDPNEGAPTMAMMWSSIEGVNRDQSSPADKSQSYSVRCVK